MHTLTESTGLAGADARDGAPAIRAWRRARWLGFAGCLLAIPAFYLGLNAATGAMLLASRALYGGMAAAGAGAFAWTAFAARAPMRFLLRNSADLALVCGAASSVIGGRAPWSSLEWVLRLAFMGVVAARIVIALRGWFAPRRLALLPLAGVAALLAAGAGFDWLEPRVHSYAEGLWLAFESGAAVGYGDIAPSTPASRVFAVFVVLSGYGMLSLAVAGIAAIFVGREERALRRELHRDIKALHAQIVALHRELDTLRAERHPGASDAPRAHGARHAGPS